MSRHEGHAKLNWFLEEWGGIKEADKYRKRDRKPKREKGSVILVMGLMDLGGFESVKDSRGGCEGRTTKIPIGCRRPRQIWNRKRETGNRYRFSPALSRQPRHRRGTRVPVPSCHFSPLAKKKFHRFTMC